MSEISRLNKGRIQSKPKHFTLNMLSLVDSCKVSPEYLKILISEVERTIADCSTLYFTHKKHKHTCFAPELNGTVFP